MTVDGLVNNAAAAHRYEKRFTVMSRDLFFQAVETNVWNSWDLVNAVIPGMRRIGGGWILNISSRLAAPRVGPPFAPHPLGGSVLYGATKATPDRITTGAALLLCTADPREVTGRIAYSLPLLKEFGREVRTPDGSVLLEGWQPQDIDESSIHARNAACALVPGDGCQILTTRQVGSGCRSDLTQRIKAVPCSW